MRFTIYQQSALGDRKVNQDRVGYSYSRNSLIMVVADGMGGHAMGEVAAEIAVETITRRFQQEARVGRIKNPAEFLENVLNAGHRAIVAHAVDRDLLECPRTTCVACIVQRGKAYWAHAGDSRLYLFREGKLVTQTNDHSKVQQMIDQGQLTPEAAATHPDRNKVYSCLGGVLPPTINVSGETALQSGDAFMLSTDGFWAQIPIPMLGMLLVKRQGDIMALVPDLIVEAERRSEGLADNISVVAMTWHDDEEALAAPTTSLDDFTTQTTTNTLTRTQRMSVLEDVTEEDIEKAIAEIQTAIKRVAR